MRKITLVILCLLLSSALCLAKEKSAPTFKQAIEELKVAIKKGDTAYLSQHIALDGIIKSKVKKYASKAEKKQSFITRTIGRLADFSEPVITRTCSSFVIKQFSRTSPSFRQRYLDALRLNKIQEQGDNAFASGSFAGSSAFLSGLRTNQKWVIVGAESPVIDREFKAMLRILHIPIN